jgi:hypothetical protein
MEAREALVKAKKKGNKYDVELTPKAEKELVAMLEDDSSGYGRFMDTYSEQSPTDKKKITAYLRNSKNVIKELSGEPDVLSKAYKAVKGNTVNRRTDIIPAIKDPETGKIYTGVNHGDAINNAPPDVRTRLLNLEKDLGQEGFVANGKYLTRAETKAQFGGQTTGQLNDTDMQNAFMKTSKPNVAPVRKAMDDLMANFEKGKAEKQRIIEQHQAQTIPEAKMPKSLPEYRQRPFSKAYQTVKGKK